MLFRKDSMQGFHPGFFSIAGMFQRDRSRILLGPPTGPRVES
jgi:hypothetical protein